MRRLVRATAVVIATLGLAAGGVLGLAAPAGADSTFTAAIESPSGLVAGTTTPIAFGGSKDADAVITDVTVDNPTSQDLTAAVCPTGGAGNTTWNCTYTPSSALVEATGSTIQIDYTNADGSSGQTAISFDVAAAPAAAPAPTSTPDPTTTPTPTATPQPLASPTFASMPAPIAVVPAAARRNFAVAPTFATRGFVATLAGSSDPAFTAAITSGLPIEADTAKTIVISGKKSSSSELVNVTDSLDNLELETCIGIGTGSTSWSCTFETDGIDASEDSFLILEQNSDGTVLQNVLTFPVTDVDGPRVPTAPEVAYEFSPAGVTVVSAATGGADSVATQILDPQELEGALISDCPNDEGVFIDNDNPPFGNNPKSARTCSGSGLDESDDDGAYVAVTAQGTSADDGEVSDDWSTGVFYVPGNDLGSDEAVPVTFTENATNRTVTVTGSVSDAGTAQDLGESDFSQGAVDILDSNGAVLCSTSTFTPIADESDSSRFFCRTSELSYGSHTLVAAIADQGFADNDYTSISTAIADAEDRVGSEVENYSYILGALSSSSPVGTVDFALPESPVTTDITPIWTLTVTGDLEPGGTITISGAGLPAGASVDTILHSVPTDLGTVIAQSDGTFVQTVQIPKNEPPGAHTIIATASGTGLVTTTMQQPITLTAPAVVPSNTKSSLSTSAEGSGIDSNGQGTAIQPNILTQALTPIADVAVHPSKIVSAIEIGLVLLLLAVLPAHLLNATIAEQSDRFERRFKRFPKRPRWLTALVAWFTSAPVVGGLIVTLVTAILFGFADPRFGWTLASLRLILACGIALFLVGYVANWLTSVIARTQWHITVLVSTRPYGLILTVVGVLISRLLHFSPGFLIGLILGLTIQGKSAAGFAWRTVVTRTCIVLAMSIAAWIGYSTLTLGGNEGGTFGTALLVETLVAIATEGIVALLIELLPLRFLEGERVYAHSRVLWGILYLLTVVVFVLGVVPWEGNWDALGNTLWIWIGVLLVFAAICVGIYIWFRNFAKPLEEEAGSEEVPIAETVAGDRS